MTTYSLPEILGALDRLVGAMGCSRIWRGESGTASPPLDWEKRDPPDIIFARADLWTLGSSNEFQEEAFAVWADEWVAFKRCSDAGFWPIVEYSPP